MFCAPRFIFGGAECVGSFFHVLGARTRFRQYRGRPIPFSCFPLQDMFLAVRRASGPVFMFCAPGHVFGGSEGVGSRFYVLNAMNLLWRNRGSRLTFSCFAFPDSFSAVRRVPGPIFMFCEPGLVFDSTKGIGSCFRILRPRTCFRRY
jgi:hypothetical protein